MLREAVVGLDGLLPVRDGDVDVLAEDHLPLGHPPQGLYDPDVALLLGDLLVAVAAEGVGTCRGERGAAGGGPGAHAAPELAQVLLRFGGGGAGRGLYLQHGLEELVGDELGQLLRQPGHDLLYLRDELPGRGVHDVELLLDPQRVARTATLELYGHRAPPLSVGAGGFPVPPLLGRSRGLRRSGSRETHEPFAVDAVCVGQHSTRFGLAGPR
ncbi:MAG: hypothetical protein AVDCRST_MAG12-2680 [uncultured Rubrobacteraceae bacterium]|uniref:Uncharacterized protein n=1 Tax=uncultured Rubrobacteraceae bacterium TaxID=349277 RepID=A0A6J4SN08_9ACTN|nr:MAG: hypothetical protein AVDCRST_MAG12-2680 [uncultured Rubrobacteraceae bacterium]